MERKPAITRELPAVRHSRGHYWIIEDATGPVSKGRCKFCGAEKDFRNFLQDCLMPSGETHFERAGPGSYPEAEHMILEEIEQVLGLTHG
jgi:hypothetical protein